MIGEGKDWFGDTYKVFRVFRGLSLPNAAVEQYRRYMASKKEFRFNSFTSTSVTESVARKFIKNAKAPGKVPCLFKMELLDRGYDKAYLHSTEYSAFPEEEEVLLGLAYWVVKEVVEEEDGLMVVTL